MADNESTETDSDTSSDTSTNTSTENEGTTKKSAAKKSGAKKAGAKKAARKSAKKSGGRQSSTRSAPRAEAPPKRMTGPRAAAEAARQLQELTGKESEGVTGLERTDEGWRVMIEVLELRRIPATTDVLASYEVTVDEDGELEGYRRQHRYVRGTPGED